MPVPRQLSRMNAQMRLPAGRGPHHPDSQQPTIFLRGSPAGSGWPGRKSRVANSATPLATLPSKKRQSHDDGRNTPHVHPGLSGRSSRLVAGHQRNLRAYPASALSGTLRQRPGIGRQSSGDGCCCVSHPDGLTPPPPDGSPGVNFRHRIVPLCRQGE